MGDAPTPPDLNRLDVALVDEPVDLASGDRKEGFAFFERVHELAVGPTVIPWVALLRTGFHGLRVDRGGAQTSEAAGLFSRA